MHTFAIPTGSSSSCCNRRRNNKGQTLLGVGPQDLAARSRSGRTHKVVKFRMRRHAARMDLSRAQTPSRSSPASQHAVPVMHSSRADEPVDSSGLADRDSSSLSKPLTGAFAPPGGPAHFWVNHAVQRTARTRIPALEATLFESRNTRGDAFRLHRRWPNNRINPCK